jgi:predicted house-cleaning NTP pyrophosphatase (Maf/HAM1 superfamily)
VHKVSTGVTLVKKSDKNNNKTDKMSEFEICCFHETTDVTFAELSDEVIQSYVETGKFFYFYKKVKIKN